MGPISTFTPEELADTKLQYSAYRASQKPTKSSQPTAKKRPGGLKGVLNNLLPIAGGALGAIAGAPLGIAGIAAGGALGSGIGEGFKEHNNGENLNVKSIAGQAAFGALPGIGSGIKALRAGEGVASLVRGGGEAAVAAAVKPSLGTKIYNKGVITEGRAGGFGQGEKVVGSETQGFRDVEKNVNTLKTEGIPRSNATSRQIAVGDRLKQHSKTIDAAVDAKNPAVDDARKADILGRVQEKIVSSDNGKGIPGFIVGNNVNSKYASSLAKQFSSVKDARGLLDFKRALDEQAINYGRNSAAPDPIKEQIAKAFRSEVNDDFGKMVPEAKAASKSYAALHDSNEFLKQAARDQSNASTQASGGTVGRLLTSDSAETLKAKAGGGLQTLGKALGGKPGAPGAGITPAPAIGKTAQVLANLTSPVQLGKAATKQSIGRTAGSILGIGTGTPPTEEQPTANVEDAPVDFGTTPDSGTPAAPAEDSSPYSVENYMSDLQRDPKNSSQYTAIFNELNPNYGKDTGGANITKVTAQQYGLAQSGAESLSKLAKLIDTDPNIVNRTAIPGKGLPIIGGAIANASGTGSYDSIGYNIADTILRLRTGATANESEVKKLQSQIMPRAGDNDETRRTKLETINSIFGNVLQLAGGQGTSDLTTEDIAAGQ